MSPRVACMAAAIAGFVSAALLSSMSGILMLRRLPGQLRSSARDKGVPSIAESESGWAEAGDEGGRWAGARGSHSTDVTMDDDEGGASPPPPLQWMRGETVAASATARLNYFHDCMDATEEEACRPDPAARGRVLPFPEWLKLVHELAVLTAPWRGRRPEVYAPPQFNTSHYAGPWLENSFISHFWDGGKYELFYPLVPIFAQWTDSVLGADREPSLSALQDLLFGQQGSAGALRADLLYVTLMTHDRVPSAEQRPCALWRNVLVLSSAGWGHVPLPALKGVVDLNYVTMYPADKDPVHYGGGGGGRNFVSTYTGVNTLGRERLWSLTVDPPATVPKDWVIQMSHMQWRWMSNGVLFTLSPRGRERGTWRTYEVLQYGRVPVVLHTDTPWLPYQHTLDFVPPQKLPPRSATGGARDAAHFGAVLCTGSEEPPKQPPIGSPFDPKDQGPQYWTRLITPGAMWGPGGVGFALSFEELPAFWCVACEFIKNGSAAVWRHVRTLPLHRYGTGQGKLCPCTTDEWRAVTTAHMGPRSGKWLLPTTSLLYEMERRTAALKEEFFTPQGVLTHIEQLVQEPHSAALKCVPRPQTALPKIT